jgi:hypothetical protein
MLWFCKSFGEDIDCCAGKYYHNIGYEEKFLIILAENLPK